jgi:hypothetical protein
MTLDVVCVAGNSDLNQYYNQETFTEREGSVQLTSSLR